ncbi:FAD-dependent oxidoreductase [Microbacterium schleiferi]|uniref:FAD-dependent oxidoreductase n=1 Tax=Microbacterium schleiferi TaxID=69362 RepID=UPI002B4BD407|nr:FAD-dependent oxidoreductase [Microbacterium schleiferi]
MSMARAQHDVVIVGAGLAGLRAAITLGHAGRDVVVLEAADGVGGRQRTDVVDGFLLDRGFQVLNPAYPAVRRWVDVQALRLKPFPVGVQVRRETGLVTLADPRRHPSLVPATLRSGLLSPGMLPPSHAGPHRACWLRAARSAGRSQGGIVPCMTRGIEPD